MNPPTDFHELPVRVVGRRNKTVWERFAEIQRHGRYFRRVRASRIEIVLPDGTCRPYVRSGSSRTT